MKSRIRWVPPSKQSRYGGVAPEEREIDSVGEIDALLGQIGAEVRESETHPELVELVHEGGV